jgi:hypothetical protein
LTAPPSPEAPPAADGLPEEPPSPLGADDIIGAVEGIIGVLDDITGGG